MRLTRLYLRNYRVFEDEVDLALPTGLIGVYGPNGAGKSCLVESVLWTLFGRSRTTKDDVRTSGVTRDCVTAVSFEHEGHRYDVRRTIAGPAAAVRAEARADGAQVAEGVRDTARYVQSVLGMDDLAFRSSVFAEQKQVAAFSQQPPAERRRLVLSLLGITPLEVARDSARREAREAREQYERLLRALPDADQLAVAAEAAAAAAELANHDAASDEAAAATATAMLARAQALADQHSERRHDYGPLVAEGKAVRAERDAAKVRVER
ncbi:MAG: AAA family ATPase, partial [Acidimicrobiales bacterium]